MSSCCPIFTINIRNHNDDIDDRFHYCQLMRDDDDGSLLIFWAQLLSTIMQQSILSIYFHTN
jgi:hypothetical protein